jgi:hypothetical protein
MLPHEGGKHSLNLNVNESVRAYRRQERVKSFVLCLRTAVSLYVHDFTKRCRLVALLIYVGRFIYRPMASTGERSNTSTFQADFVEGVPPANLRNSGEVCR